MRNPRQELKETLIIERKIYELGCEGQQFKEHECIGGLHMHEAIFSRGQFRHIKGKARDYFWDRRNCAILCSVFHAEYGHTREFKEHWEIYAERYGDVKEFIWNAPLKIKS